MEASANDPDVPYLFLEIVWKVFIFSKAMK